mmetsp:Transcript_65737/g.122576  ORF Transcript_65737/g.122576 Transcript_65737/m.122576 type:complete len:89 (-) Transcript_65737:127-393(-)
MFPCLQLPMTDIARFNMSSTHKDVEARLAAAESQYAAKQETIRMWVPTPLPIGYDPKDGASKEDDDDAAEEAQDNEEYTDDDGPADRF